MDRLFIDIVNHPVEFVVSFGLPLVVIGLHIAYVWHRKPVKALLSACLLVAVLMAVLDGDGLLRYFLNMGELSEQQSLWLAVLLVVLILATMVAGVIQWRRLKQVKAV